MTVLPTDLSSAEEVDRLIAEIKSRALRIDILINNAGLGVFENFLDTTFRKQVKQVDLNIRALIALTHAFAPGMVAMNRAALSVLPDRRFPALHWCNCVCGIKSVRFVF